MEIKERETDLNNLYDLLESELPLFINSDLLHRLRTCRERYAASKRRIDIKFESFEDDDADAVRFYIEYIEPLLLGESYRHKKRVAFHFLYRGRS